MPICPFPHCPLTRFFGPLVLAFGLGASVPTIAAPHKPAQADTVLERLPGRLDSADQARIASLRAQFREKPDDAALAAELAEQHYRIAQRQGDPRHIGYAQAILARWQDSVAPPSDVRLVRALLAQFMHDFGSARRDLDAVLAAEPGNLAALSYRAVLNLVSANYGDALRDCDALARHGKGLVIEACRPTADALTGRAAAAYATLQDSLSKHRAAPANERLWVLTRLAEIALRLDQPAQADAHFRAALGLGIVDQYVLASYAEFLIDAGRYPETIALLRDHTSNDVLLLRLAIAEKASGHADAKTHAELIAARFEANRRRGDKTHLADEAWFELQFAGNPQRALALASENWATEQREPGDARIFLEAALAARNPAAAEPVRKWLDESAIEDTRLRALAAKLHRAAEPAGAAK